MATQESRPESEVLDIRDVLPAVPFDRAEAEVLGASLIFRTEGDHTVVSVDPDAGGPAVAVRIATLEGVTGITLQQLLNNIDIAC
jgi:hypothetical protein